MLTEFFKIDRCTVALDSNPVEFFIAFLRALPSNISFPIHTLIANNMITTNMPINIFFIISLPPHLNPLPIGEREVEITICLYTPQVLPARGGVLSGLYFGIFLYLTQKNLAVWLIGPVDYWL